jgi:hypothetical protein
MRPAGREGGAGISSIVITDPPKWALSLENVVLSQQLGSTIPVKGTGLGTITRIDVQARKPDSGALKAYGPIASATSTNQFATWNAPNVVIPDVAYTRILARAYNNAGFVWQTFNDVKYVVGAPDWFSAKLSDYPISTLTKQYSLDGKGATGCPPLAISSSSYIVNVTKSGTTITAKDTEGRTWYNNVHAADAIQEAIYAANDHGGGRAHVKGGVAGGTPVGYNISSEIEMRSNVMLEGDGATRTKLQCTKPGINILSSGGRSNIGLQGLTLDGAEISDKILNFASNTNVLIQKCILERHHSPYDPTEAHGPGVYISDVLRCTFFNNISRDHFFKGDKCAIGGTNIRVIKNELTGMKHENGSITSGGMVDGEIAWNWVHHTLTYAGTSFENQSRRTQNVDIHHNTYEQLVRKQLNGIDWPIAIGTVLLFVTNAQNPYIFDRIWFHHNTIKYVLGSAVQQRLGTKDPITGVVKPAKLITNLKVYDNNIWDVFYDAVRIGPVKGCVLDRNTINGKDFYAVRIQTPLYSPLVSEDVKIGSTDADKNKISNMSKGGGELALTRPTLTSDGMFMKAIPTGSKNIVVNGVRVAGT